MWGALAGSTGRQRRAPAHLGRASGTNRLAGSTIRSPASGTCPMIQKNGWTPFGCWSSWKNTAPSPSRCRRSGSLSLWEPLGRAGRLSLPLALHGPPETRSCASGCELGFTFNSQASFLCLAQPGIPSILFNFHARVTPSSLAVDTTFGVSCQISFQPHLRLSTGSFYFFLAFVFNVQSPIHGAVSCWRYL